MVELIGSRLKSQTRTGDCLVQMHFQRLVYHAARERAVPASISDEEERARLNA